MVKNTRVKIIVAVVVMMLLLLWVELAIGIFSSPITGS